MSDKIAVLTGGNTYTLDVHGPAVYSDEALSTPVTMPASVTADTTWYVASRVNKPGGFGVRVTAADGTYFERSTPDKSVPGTIDCVAGLIADAVSAENVTGGSTSPALGSSENPITDTAGARNPDLPTNWFLTATQPDNYVAATDIWLETS